MRANTTHARSRSQALAAVATWLCASSTSAQAGAPGSDGAAPAALEAPLSGTETATTSVTVVAKTPDSRTTIDGRSYSVANDLQKSAGSLADVLRHIPSVQVDPEGVVSLRGDQSVTILVDGKPSALFSGPGRAQALQSMSADQYDRVEVMTNPSAAQLAEGSGGVINLISRPARSGAAAESASGTVKANVGSGDRFDLGASGDYSAKGVSLSGGVDLRRSAYVRDIDTRYGLVDPASGALASAEQRQVQDDRTDTLTLYGNAGLDLDPHDHLDAGVNAIGLRIVQPQNRTYQSDAQTGPLALDFVAPGVLHSHFTSVSGSVGLTHSDGDKTLSTNLSLSTGDIDAQTIADYSYQTPLRQGFYQNLVQTAAFPELDLTIAYKSPLPNTAKLGFGYELKLDRQGEENQNLQGASAALALADPAFDQKFRFEQRVQAAYVDYEQTIGGLTIKPGLRLEATALDTDLLTFSQKGTQSYFAAFPSLHLSFAPNETSQFNASYGRRVLRPDESQLDPFKSIQQPDAVHRGKPWPASHLHPIR